MTIDRREMIGALSAMAAASARGGVAGEANAADGMAQPFRD